MDTQASYTTLQPGEMLNWYRIERILGRGGFGVIYLATDTNLDHQVAIKEYIPSDVATRASDSKVQPITEEQGDMFLWGMDRFIKEARNLVKFKHPNIVRVMSVFQENNTAYMVMEFEEGEDLRSYLKKPGNVSEQALKQLILPISKGLAEVHRHGFIHRDIKPANILVRKDGSPVLLDFGSARSASKFTQQSLTALVSVGYAPLEQYNQEEGDEQQGPWTDIYALGGTLYFAISGKDPVESTRRGAAVLNGGKDPLIAAAYLGEGKYSQPFLRAIDWAMHFGIAERPQTLEQWMQALLADSNGPDTSVTQDVRHQALHKNAHLSTQTASQPSTSTGTKTNRQARSVDTKTLDELADATVLSRERRTGPKDTHRPTTNTTTSSQANNGVFGLAGLAFALSLVALGLWFVTGQKGPQDVALVEPDRTDSTQATSATTPEQTQSEIAEREAQQAEQERLRKAEQAQAEKAQAEQEQLALAEQAEIQQQQKALAEQAQAEAAREALLAAEKAQKAAEEAELAAVQRAKADALAKQEAERKRVQALADKKLDEQRLAAARQERRLKQAISAAQTSLGVGDLNAAQQQLITAESIDNSDTRVQTLAFAVQSALDEYNTPVSDADIETVTTMFVALREAIKNKDLVELDRLAEPSSQQSTIFKSLMKSFETIDVSIAGIRVRNADKSIAGTLRIDSLLRANGDRGSLSDKYTTRTITSRRKGDGWSKIEW